MRKSVTWGPKWLLFVLIGANLCFAPIARTADTNTRQISALSNTLLQRAQDEVARIEALVADGTLPKSSLDEAKAKLADAQDQQILWETLYGTVRVQDLTEDQGEQMLTAAQRRVDRQQKIVEDRQKLLENGIMARSDLAAFQDELDSRERVLELAKNRIQLMGELRQMAETEQRLQRAAQAGARTSANAMMRYDGNGLFSLSDLPTISTEYEKRFHAALPVSAVGQTLLHQSMGLDHRNRVDVALNPDSNEGIWLRQLLERLHVPYLAFRAAMVGAATAPHIHIGPESTRLKFASR